MAERILVVDDELSICDLLQGLLGRQGYEVQIASHGAEALARLQDTPCDLVMTDLKMPVMDGLELLRQIKARFPGVDVIMLTGYSTVKTAVEAMQAGAYTYVAKPFHVDELLLTVQNCLEARRLRQEKERLSALVALLELGRTLTSNLDLPSLYDQILVQITQTFAPDCASIMLLNATGDRLDLVAGWGLAARITVGAAYPVAHSIAGQVMELGQPTLLIQDRLDPRFAPYARRPEIGAAMCVPLSYRGRTLGVLNVARQRERPAYTYEDLRLLAVFAVQAAIALQNALLYHDLRTLERVSWRLTAMLDREPIIQTTLGVVRDIIQPDVAALSLWNGETDSLSTHILATRPLSSAAERALRERLVSQCALFQPDMPTPDKLRLEFRGAAPTLSEAQTLASFTAAMLLHRECVFGLLLCASELPDAFSEDSVHILSTLANTSAIALQNATAYQRLKDFNLQVISSLSTALEARDPYTRGHSERVARFAMALAAQVGLSAGEIEQLRMAGLLHDIGKVRVSDLILNKPGPLTAEEWACMREHPVVGARIVAGVASLGEIAPIIRHHHEAYDGSGYPDHLCGQRIPLAARILAVTDAFEAMTSDRAYRKGCTTVEALRVLQGSRNRQWDAQLVDAWCLVVRQNPDLLESRPLADSVPEDAGLKPPR